MKWLFLSLLFAAQHAVAAEEIFYTDVEPTPASRVMITGDRQFDMADSAGRSCEKSDPSCREDLKRLKAQKTKLPIFISERAIKACNLAPEQLVAELEAAYAGPGKALESLKKAFSDMYLYPYNHTVLVIDHLGDAVAKTRSFHLPDYPKRFESRVILDCQSGSRQEWAPLLAHELAHVLLQRGMKNSEAWFEEMIAQLVEVEAGGRQPEFNLRVLQELQSWPALTDAGPGEYAPSPAFYAHSYLFGKYLTRVYGGWGFIKWLVKARLSDIGYCTERFPAFDCAVYNMAKNGAFADLPIWNPYDVSGDYLRRTFALAVAMNDPSIAWLYIGSRWQRSTLAQHPMQNLPPRQFYVVDASAGVPKNDKISVFRIFNGRFELLNKDQMPAAGDRLLVMNQTKDELILN